MEVLDLNFKETRQGGWHFTTNDLFRTAGPTVENVLKIKNKLGICYFLVLTFSALLNIRQFRQNLFYPRTSGLWPQKTLGLVAVRGGGNASWGR